MVYNFVLPIHSDFGGEDYWVNVASPFGDWKIVDFNPLNPWRKQTLPWKMKTRMHSKPHPENDGKTMENHQISNVILCGSKNGAWSTPMLSVHQQWHINLGERCEFGEAFPRFLSFERQAGEILGVPDFSCSMNFHHATSVQSTFIHFPWNTNLGSENSPKSID